MCLALSSKACFLKASIVIFYSKISYSFLSLSLLSYLSFPKFSRHLISKVPSLHRLGFLFLIAMFVLNNNYPNFKILNGGKFYEFWRVIFRILEVISRILIIFKISFKIDIRSIDAES